jgi:septal ring factor EnvC (AmiA/AmiB activator)
MRPEWRLLLRVAVLSSGLLLVLSALPQQKPAPKAGRPELTSEQKAELRDLQYQIAKVEAQLLQLQIQYQQLQQQHKDLTDRLAILVSKVTASVDHSKWVLDTEKLEFVPSASPKQ